MRNRDYTRAAGLTTAEVQVPSAVTTIIMMVVIGVAAFLIWQMLHLPSARQDVTELAKPAVKLTSR